MAALEQRLADLRTYIRQQAGEGSQFERDLDDAIRRTITTVMEDAETLVNRGTITRQIRDQVNRILAVPGDGGGAHTFTLTATVRANGGDRATAEAHVRDVARQAQEAFPQLGADVELTGNIQVAEAT